MHLQKMWMNLGLWAFTKRAIKLYRLTTKREVRLDWWALTQRIYIYMYIYCIYADICNICHDVELMCIHTKPWGSIWGHSRNVSGSSIDGHLQNVTCRSWKRMGMKALKFDVWVLQNLKSWTCGHSRRNWNCPRDEKKSVPSSGDSDECRRQSKRKEASDHKSSTIRVPCSTIQAQQRNWI
jgi:hypothetical protein